MLGTIKSCFPNPAWKGNDALIPKSCSFHLCYLLNLISFVNKFLGLLQEK